MSYLTDLKEFNIDQADIDRIAAAWRQRAANLGEAPHPAAIYQTAAVDIAMGLIELHRETAAAMHSDHPPRTWLAIVSGVDLPQAGGSNRSA